MMRNCFCLLLLFCLLLACNRRQRSSSDSESSVVNEIHIPENKRFEVSSSANESLNLRLNDSIRYAVGFNVTYHEGFTRVDVRDPWNKGRLLQRYLLVGRDRPLPKVLPSGTIIRVPLRRMVVYTAVHLAELEALGAIDEVVGVCESRYIKIPAVKVRMEDGLIKDMGEATLPNIEKMVEAGAEVVIASPFEHGGYGAVEKTGIPVIELSEYMEIDPLGRAEWIKLLALLTDHNERADSLFRETETNYLRLKTLAENVAYRPKLMTELKYGSTWYVPGGESFMARIFKDAGADYLFGYLSGAGGVPLTFETVLDKAIHADIWVAIYNRDEEMTYKSLRSDYALYERFDAFRNRRIFGCNTNYSLYYEEAPLRPDYLLSELIAIFHPNLLPEHQFRYFSPLSNNE